MFAIAVTNLHSIENLFLLPLSKRALLARPILVEVNPRVAEGTIILNLLCFTYLSLSLVNCYSPRLGLTMLFEN